MVRGRLAQAAVDKAGVGKHHDGRGLILQVRGPQNRSWLYRYQFRGRERWLGLGSASEVTLAEARNLRDDARAQIRKGSDPVQQKRAGSRENVAFRERAAQYIEAHEAGWRNAKHRTEWRSSLERYAFPIIGDLPVEGITTGLIVEILRPIWSKKAETASRVRGRIEAVLDYAANPDDAAWRNPASMTAQLRKTLPRMGKRPQHHPALSYEEVTPFMTALRQRDGIAARALEFTILTAARTGEAIGARWSEMDLTAGLWIVPPERMKAGKEHRVPLSPTILAILRALPREAEFVFPGGRRGQPLSGEAMRRVLRTMGRHDITVHGFRSTFRDWSAECTAYAHEVAEAALAHLPDSKVVAAYQRGDLLEKRRRLMDDWAQFCLAQPSFSK